MKKIRALLAKINNAIRPPHVGPRQPTDITARGGTSNPNDDAVMAGWQSGGGVGPS